MCLRNDSSTTTAQQIRQSIEDYIQELERFIERETISYDSYIQYALAVLNEIKSVQANKIKYHPFYLSALCNEQLLIEILQKTTNLINTPILTIEHTINPAFTKAVKSYEESIKLLASIKSSALLAASMKILMTAACVAATILIAIFIGPLMLPAAFVLALAPACAMTILSRDIVSEFSTAYKTHGLMKSMRPLLSAVKSSAEPLTSLKDIQ